MANPWAWFQRLETQHKIPLIAAAIVASGAIIAALIGFGIQRWGSKPVQTALLATAIQEPTLTPTPSGLSNSEYAMMVQLIACDQTNVARDYGQTILDLTTAFTVDPSPERVANFMQELRKISTSIAAATDDAIGQLDLMEPPDQFRRDHETYVASLRTINRTFSEFLRRSRELGDNPSLEDLDSLLGDMIAVFAAGLVGIQQEEYSSEFKELITCRFPAKDPVGAHP